VIGPSQVGGPEGGVTALDDAAAEEEVVEDDGEAVLVITSVSISVSIAVSGYSLQLV